MDYVHVDVLELIDQPPTKLSLEYQTFPIGPSIKPRQIPTRPNILRYKLHIKDGEKKQLRLVLRILGQREPYASTNIPLKWIEPGTIVKECFQMRTINKPYQTMLIRLAIHRSKVKCQPFVGGRVSSLLIVPTWRRPIDCEPPKAAILRQRREQKQFRRARQQHQKADRHLIISSQVPNMSYPIPEFHYQMQPVDAPAPIPVVSPYVEEMKNLVPNSQPTDYPSNLNYNIYSQLMQENVALYAQPPVIDYYPVIPI